MRVGLKLAPFRSSQTCRVPTPVPGLQEDFEIWQEDFDEMNDQVYGVPAAHEQLREEEGLRLSTYG